MPEPFDAITRVAVDAPDRLPAYRVSSFVVDAIDGMSPESAIVSRPESGVGKRVAGGGRRLATSD